MDRLPFEGVRVLDLSSVWAAPYAVEFLALLGADVIKVEYPGRPDFRLFGPFADDDPGERFWERSGTFNLLHRNKQGVTLDLRASEGLALFRHLAEISDVVVENYTPRVMKQFTLDYASLRRLRPDIIMLSFTGYGHTGPWSHFPAVGDAMEATAGFCEVTGYENGPPMKAGYAYVDLIAAWYCAIAMAAALEHREKTGTGQWLDVSMYECGVSFLGDALLAYSASRAELLRIGNKHPWAAPHGCFRCAGDDRWVALGVASDRQWHSVCAAMGRPDLAEDARFSDGLQRWRNKAELHRVVETWTSRRCGAEIVDALQALGVPAFEVFNNRDLLTSEHLALRGFYEVVRHSERSGLGSRLYPMLPFRLGAQRPAPSRPAPGVGDHNTQVFGDLLGLGSEEMRGLRESKLLMDRPADLGTPFKALSLETLLNAGQIVTVDSDYKDRLREARSGLDHMDHGKRTGVKGKETIGLPRRE